MQRLSSLLFALIIFSLGGCSQKASKPSANQKDQKEIKVGDPCEGCEAIYESPIPFDQLTSVDTLPDFNDAGPKIEISGIVYKRDGKTPAPDVVIYVYHTNQKGVYPTKGDEKGWAKRHGYIRGWVKTDKNGFYQFFTLRPAAYPERRDPQHIHVTVKEPGKSEYWIDEYLFADDPLLTKPSDSDKPKGGSGIITLQPPQNGISHATRHITLGINVTNYPTSALPKLSSGLALGSNCPAFDPIHLSGVDSGKTACPMCKYGYGKGVMVWFNHSNLDHMSEFVKTLETEMQQRGERNFRVFLVYMNPFYKTTSETERDIIRKKLKEWCRLQNLQKVAMTWIPSPVDEETAGLYKINPDAMNTVFVYKQRKIAAKWVNIEYDKTSLNDIMENIDTKTNAGNASVKY